MPLLEVRDLSVEFRTGGGVARVLDRVSYRVDPGEVLAVLGESGAGKSVGAHAVLGLLAPPGRVAGGQVLFHGRDLLALPERERRQVRGRQIAMVFQDALSALNPVLTVGYQLAEALRTRQGMGSGEARRRAAELLDLVRIPDAPQRLRQYPHEFSGGMRQRVLIAMALALRPELLIADEPTTALDVTVQAQIIDLLDELRRELGMALLLITHDLGVVAGIADRIAVLYAGRVVEHGRVDDLYRAPAHPYTRGLLASVPRLDRTGGDLPAIDGLPPDLTRVPGGCPFHPRCPYAQPACRVIVPVLAPLGPGRESACHFAREVAALG